MTLPDLDPSNVGQLAFYQTDKPDPVGNMKQYLDTYEEYSNGVDGIYQVSDNLVYNIRVRIKDDGYIIAYTSDAEVYKVYNTGEEAVGTWITSVYGVSTPVGIPNGSHYSPFFRAISGPLASAYGYNLSLGDGVGYYHYSYPDATNLSLFTDQGFTASYTSGVEVEIHTISNAAINSTLKVDGGDYTKSMDNYEAFKIPSQYGGGSTIAYDDYCGFTSLWR